MSRHEFVDDAGSTWTVGWDEPMVTYFAQREIRHDGLDDDDLEDIAGTSIGDVTTLDGLLERLREHVQLPEEIHARLEREQPEFTAAPIAQAIAKQDQLGAHLRDAFQPGSEVQR